MIMKVMMKYQYLRYENSGFRIFEHEMKFKFNDDLKNPIFNDYEVFVKIVDDLYGCMYSNGHKLINNEECKKVIEEIHIECGLVHGDYFDL